MPNLRKSEQTQKTKPKKGKPAEIPVPERKDVERDLLKIAKPTQRNPDGN